MKIAILTSNLVSNLNELKAIPVESFTGGELKFVQSKDKVYIYNHDQSNLQDGIEPDNQVNDLGYWSSSPDSILLYKVEDNYDFNANSATDITSIHILHLHGERLFDYSCTTKEMAILFTAKSGADEAAKLTTCTESEKLYLSMRHIIADKAIRESIVGASGMDFKYFCNHAGKSIQSRKARIDAASVAIGYILSDSFDRADLFNSVMPLIYSFVSTNNSNLKKWFKSMDEFATTGLNSKTYPNKTQIEAVFVAIVENGEY